MRGLNFSLAFLLLCFGFIVPSAVRAADPPTIKEVKPKKVTVSNTTDDLRIRITGKRLKKSSKVLVNNAEVTSKFQDGDLLAFIPANLLATPGTLSVMVKNDALVSKADTVQVVAATNIVITAIRPAIVVANSIFQNFGVEVQGENFTGGAFVRVGGVRTNTDVKRKGELSFAIGTVDFKEIEFKGSVPVQIENGDGTLSNTFNIIIAPPGPNLNELDPGSLDIGTADKVIKLKGSNFDSTSQVFINGQLVTSTLKKNKKTKAIDIEATVPGALLNQVTQLTVKVNNVGVGDSDILLLDVTPGGKAPLIYSVDPVSIVAGSNQTEVIVLGANIDNVGQLLINGTKVDKDDITEVSKKAVTVKIKEKMLASPGTLNIQITNKNGSSNMVPLTVESAPTVTTIAGKLPGFVDGVGTDALFVNPAHAVVGPDGMIYIADQANHAIRRLNPSTNEVTTIAGDSLGRQGYVDTEDIDDNDPTVRFSNPLGIVVDQSGTFYISDFGNNVIRRMRIDAQGNVTVDTFAGRSRVVKDPDTKEKERVGVFGFLNDEASLARFSGPYGIVLDPDGNLLVADSANNVVRKVIIANGEAQSVETLAGNGFPGLSDGDSASVQFRTPIGLFMSGGLLLVSDFGNNSIRVVDTGSAQVETVVGLRRAIQSDVLNQINRNAPTFGDGTRFFAVLDGPISVTADDTGRLYFIDFRRDRIRRVNLDGSVTTIVGGNGDGDNDGLGIPKAQIRQARYLFFFNGDLYLVDSGNNRIRRIDLAN